MLKLSIALTTYNHEKYIAKALDSIFNQKINFDFEVVIGNDNSTDNTYNIIKKYENKYSNIRCINYNENVGYTINLDKTLRACKAEYISIFDGDDIMLPNKLQTQVDFLDNNPDFVMSTHKVRAFKSEDNKTIRWVTPNKKKDYYTIKDIIKYGSIFANSSKVFRKEAYPKEGIDYNIKKIADWYITVLIVNNGKINYFDESFVDYRVHSKSIMGQINGDTHFRDKIYILNSFSNIFDKKYDYLFNRQYAYAFLIRGIFLYEQNKVREARMSFVKSIKHCVFYSISPYLRLLLSFLPKKLYNYFSNKYTN